MSSLDCYCAVHMDGTITTMLCPIHATTDPCRTLAEESGKRRRGSIVRGRCTRCGWTDEVAR